MQHPLPPRRVRISPPDVPRPGWPGRRGLCDDFAVDVTENWQSEFLRFFLYIFGTVYLLQRDSPESKPVGATHEATGVEG
ncbi:hypothetical protein OG988_37420 [Streptomyces zaomyceticus]